ncbi:Flp pilus assembly complex ATPase component TadA [Candidatus Peregrinibacteria bacterium]|nr:Flp pilus assembly complex ATPase component TadA [Candidatus Peregrinibacteria bacterium]
MAEPAQDQTQGQSQEPQKTQENTNTTAATTAVVTPVPETQTQTPVQSSSTGNTPPQKAETPSETPESSPAPANTTSQVIAANTAAQSTASATLTVEKATPKTDNSQPQNVDETLTKINRAFKERAAVQKAKELGISYINISVTPINPDLLRLIPPEIAKKALVLPFFRLGKKLRIAVADPSNEETRKVIEQLKSVGFAINTNLATDDGLVEAMRLYDTEQYKVKKEITTTLSEEKIKAYEEEIKQLNNLSEKIKTINSEEAVYLINIGALKTGASDIHYEPEEKMIRLRFRIDGILHKIFDIDKATFVNIANQIKYQCKMKLNITNEAQDGRYSFVVNDRKVDLRVSILPTEYGETFVCRLLDSERKLSDFDEMGFNGANLAHINRALTIKHGMILITGPTGSGKTTTLYKMLEQLNKPESKVITLEDPIEYHLRGISQSQINEKRGYDFANGLRAILRQDPDVVMLGEIRDLETAETAAQAALTGHVLLSTLHTNSAIEAIPRLINIGLPAFMVAPALDTVIAQRLVRRFCPKCTELKPIEKTTLEELQKTLEFIRNIQPSLKIEIPGELPQAIGCEICSHTGYKGRICVVEVLQLDPEIRDLILNKASSVKMIEAARRKGMLTMREDGILKVIQGLTSLQEVHRVTAIGG